MTDETTDLARFELPYSRKAELREVHFEGGMKMLRLILREGRRLTQVDLDAASASALADEMQAWAKDNS